MPKPAIRMWGACFETGLMDLSTRCLSGTIGGSGTVPAPLPPIVPERQRVDKSINPVSKHAPHIRIAGFGIQIVEPDKRSHKTVEDTGRFTTRNLGIQDAAIQRNANSGIFHVKVKYLGGAFEQFK